MGRCRLRDKQHVHQKQRVQYTWTSTCTCTVRVRVCSEFVEQQERERQRVVQRLLKEESNVARKHELYPNLFLTRKSEESKVAMPSRCHPITLIHVLYTSCT